MAKQHPDFTGYWRQLKNEGFDEYLKVLGLPWTVRKIAKKFGNGSTDMIWQSGNKLRVTTLNAKGSWTRYYIVDRDVQQKNAAGETVRTKTWWEGKVLKSKMVGSSFGTMESWRYMEGTLMVVKSKVVTKDRREAAMYWFFEALPFPHKHRVRSTSDKLRHVWKDQKLVDRATRRDNCRLEQLLLPDPSRWETPADHFIHVVASSNSEDKMKFRSPRSSKPVSPSSSVRALVISHAKNSQLPANCNAAAEEPVVSASSGNLDAGPSTTNGTHRRVMSDTVASDVMSNDTFSLGDASELPTERDRADTTTSVSSILPEIPPSGRSVPLDITESDKSTGLATIATNTEAETVVCMEEQAAPSEDVYAGGMAKGLNETNPLGSAHALSESDALSGDVFSGVDSPGVESPGVESPRSVKSVDERRSVASDALTTTIRATPRGTPHASLDQKNLEKVLAWKINEFKDSWGIASVVPVKNPTDTTEPELLQMSPEQAEQTYVKLKQLEQQAKLDRQQNNHSVSCFCFMVSLHDFNVPDYLKSWEM